MPITSGRGDGRNRYGSGRRRQGSSLGGRPSSDGRFLGAAEQASGDHAVQEASAASPGSAQSGEDGSDHAGSSSEPARKTPPTSEYDRAKEIVLRQLTASARSRSQLEEKLRSKEIGESTISEILDKYEDLGLVDDQQFAEMFVRSRAMSRKLAKPALRRELANKGVTGEVAEAALAQRTDEDERTDASELVRKKLKSSVDLTDRTAREKELRRLASMLSRRGYAPGLSFEVAKAELDRAASGQDEFNAFPEGLEHEAYEELP
ncbi:regulatory protein RecX [Kocuria sp. HSID16901]|uniref:regulatory protein RecX n=1 Tax=Kocuria sp. HSID16901 TaxID=2419505 RepID=UPI000A84821F|nr:regulatory protein RecX [Kocuria sp. HSID16901]RUQ21115.1 regulatory protein RecX [Kocuria sp. HSID16901]